MKFHKTDIFSPVVLKVGRFATGLGGKSITMYNNKTFKPDLLI